MEFMYKHIFQKLNSYFSNSFLAEIKMCILVVFQNNNSNFFLTEKTSYLLNILYHRTIENINNIKIATQHYHLHIKTHKRIVYIHKV